jgi:hypothetical protein
VAIDLVLSETNPIESVLGSAKIPTTSDTSHGINEALKGVIHGLSQKARDHIIAVNIGTTVSVLSPSLLKLFTHFL